MFFSSFYSFERDHLGIYIHQYNIQVNSNEYWPSWKEKENFKNCKQNKNKNSSPKNVFFCILNFLKAFENTDINFYTYLNTKSIGVKTPE